MSCNISRLELRAKVKLKKKKQKQNKILKYPTNTIIK